VIDLGEMSREADRPEADRPEVDRAVHGGRTGVAVRAGPRRRPRAALTALVSAAVLLAGSTPPDGPPLAESRIDAGLADNVRVMGDQAYVIRPDLSIPRRLPRIIASHQLPDGQLLWQTSLVIRGTVRKTVALPSVTLVSIDRLDGVETVAVEASTAHVRWRRPYLLIDVAQERGLALAAGTATGSAPAVSTLAALDLATGQTRWEQRVPDDTWHFLQRQWAVSALPSGRVEVRELDHGQLVTAADLRPPVPSSITSWVQPAGDLLLVATSESTVVAYGLPGFDRRWQAEWELTDWSVSPDCGRAGPRPPPIGLCVFSRTVGLRVVDPATGRTRWSDSRWISAELAGGRLLARGRQRPGSGSVAALLDPATGRVLLDLGRWTAVGRPGASDDALLAAQIDGRRGLAWFGAIDPRSLTVQVLDSANGVGTDCLPGPDSLVCRRRDASVTVWRLPHP
jgi:outer membrane protein assembly factor BamB